MSREEQFQTIYDEQGRPGATAFRFAVRRAGKEISESEARAFVAKQSIGQVFQARIPSDGVVPGGGREDHRWQMDLIDFSKRIAKLNQGHRYVLIAIDNFNRQAFTQPMPSKTAAATLEAFRKIIRANDGEMPKEILVDLGNEYAQLEQEIVNNGGVLTRKNMHAVNTLAVVDRAIAKLKTILSGYNLNSWAESLKRATEVYNNRSHSYLMQSAPDDVKGSAELQYELEKTHGVQIRHNNSKWAQKAKKLRDAGAFRNPRPRDTWQRVDAPTFENKVLNVDSFKGSHVESGDQSFPIKTTLAVPGGSADMDLGETGPGAAKRTKQKEVLQEYADRLHRLIPTTGLTLAAARTSLQSMRGAVDNMDVYGPARGGRYVSFLKLFPKLFEIIGSGPGIRVKKAAAPARPAPAAPAAPAADRAVRGPDVAVRMPRQGLPGNTATAWKQDNPKRANTAAYARYETYKGASSLAEARLAGMTSQDLQADLARGHVRLL